MATPIIEPPFTDLEEQLISFFQDIKLVKQVLTDVQNNKIKITRKIFFLCKATIRDSLGRLNSYLATYTEIQGINIRSQTLENLHEAMPAPKHKNVDISSRHITYLLTQANHVWDDAAEHCKRLDELLIEAD